MLFVWKQLKRNKTGREKNRRREEKDEETNQMDIGADRGTVDRISDTGTGCDCQAYHG
jgi:hypothetical protein